MLSPKIVGAFLLSVLGAVGSATGVSAGCDLNFGSFGTPIQYSIATGVVGYKLGYNLCATSVASSDSQFLDWEAGKYDLVSTAFDNLMNRKYNGNFGRNFAINVLAGADTQPSQSIIANRGISTFAGLTGKNIAVDSASSGYVLTFRAVAADNGLYNFNLIPVGGGTARNTALRSGFFTYPSSPTALGYAGPDLAGTTIEIHACIVNGIQAITYPTDPYQQGPAVKLAELVDYVAPLQGSSLAIQPTLWNNSTKISYVQTYLQAMMIGQAYIQNPANKDSVIAYLASSQKVSTDYATQQYNAYGNPLAGIQYYDPYLHISRTAALNVAYLRQRFDSFDVTYDPNNAKDKIDFTPLFKAGPGQFIDYTILENAKAVFDSQIKPVKGAPADSFLNQCVYPATGQTYTVASAVATVKAALSGGCTQKPVVAFVGCVPQDNGATYSDCVYNSATDSISIVAKSPDANTARKFVVTYSVKEACGYSSTFTQTVVVYPTPQTGCTQLAPPCQAQLQVNQVSQSTWTNGGASVPTTQYQVTLTNPSSQKLLTLSLGVSGDDNARITNIWSLTADSNNANTYLLPSYANGINANGGSYSFGYIANGYNAVTFNPTATCQ